MDMFYHPLSPTFEQTPDLSMGDAEYPAYFSQAPPLAT
jgi:hypothetical protein